MRKLISFIFILMLAMLTVGCSSSTAEDEKLISAVEDCIKAETEGTAISDGTIKIVKTRVDSMLYQRKQKFFDALVDYKTIYDKNPNLIKPKAGSKLEYEINKYSNPEERVLKNVGGDAMMYYVVETVTHNDGLTNGSRIINYIIADRKYNDGKTKRTIVDIEVEMDLTR